MAKDINRRNFLKTLGGGVVASSALLAACSGKNRQNGSSQDAAAGEMTMRVNHNTGDKVGLLGYGMMRLPSQGRTIDQDMVNRQVDYGNAIFVAMEFENEYLWGRAMARPYGCWILDGVYDNWYFLW